MASSTSSTRSNSSRTTHSSRKRRSSNTQITGNRGTFLIAYPAPVFTDKTPFIKLLRPRRYLQLQTLSEDGRHHEPVLDVISLAPPKDPRRLVASISRHLASLSHDKCLRLDRRDILLVRSGDEDLTPGGEGVMARLEELTKRKVVAVLRTKCKIVMEDGSIWLASTRPNGSFEFTSTNQHGETRIARWVPPPRSRTSSSSSPPDPNRTFLRPIPEPIVNEPTFNFSLIDPTVRRHAVLATLSPSSLHIKDTYHEPVSVSGGLGSITGGKISIVDGATKALILATAAWVNLHLDWASSYSNNRVP